ncbi:M55 family metallopeptidase [Tissierella praeacuta]|uniref:D-amino peptidase n=1 Tax=Tissierella praeacuta DSM 18095 TaxID=1123404 RepID=A0A1M4TPX3_9FIRM|nr:M55 family metallopeptidase [Tissierella praeacuta]MBU5255966.1 M55 family metallopeptidase [Tissierella praeacuta]TCU77405.1 D-amino peptidase [Tissierella praeacuta]SHE46503.1 D-amino peptidase [Tissierella praeacuta DSM 18095]SUP04421.1 D-aminopeptidase [Tissierella praeacuta]
MKIYISVDIEGITGVTSWGETELGNSEHIWAANQMTKETIAACEAAIEMGAKEIVVKDAHDSARNIDISKLPMGTSVIRGWTSSPESMMAGIDESFDATIFIGYHSAAGHNGNPLAHTMDSQKAVYFKINGEIVSEFTINSFISAYYGVPVVFLSGDKMLCEKSKELVPNMETVAVKDGEGGATFNMHPNKACECIKNGVKEGLKKINECKIQSPEEFKLEIRFREHKDANRARYYPGAKLIDDHTVEYVARDIQDMITAKMFML